MALDISPVVVLGVNTDPFFFVVDLTFLLTRRWPRHESLLRGRRAVDVLGGGEDEEQKGRVFIDNAILKTKKKDNHG